MVMFFLVAGIVVQSSHLQSSCRSSVMGHHCIPSKLHPRMPYAPAAMYIHKIRSECKGSMYMVGKRKSVQNYKIHLKMFYFFTTDKFK